MIDALKQQDISIHPPLAGRDYTTQLRYICEVISIHPPLAGRDRGARRRDRHVDISIHPPLAGRDLHQAHRVDLASDFNPPAPCGAGRRCLSVPLDQMYFNPPAPCGAGPDGLRLGNSH